MFQRIHEPFRRGLRACGRVAVASVCLAWAASPGFAGLIFSEPFQYPVGSNLAGQSGGAGFTGAWGSGISTIVAGLNGGGSAVSINGKQVRQLSSTISTTGTTTYISYLMNSSNFANGNYTGLDLILGENTQQLFFGIPWSTQKFGFDAHESLPIRSIDFTPSVDTTYLIAVGLMPSGTAGKVDIKMWATPNLAIDANTLVAGSPNAQLIGSKDNFSFDRLWVDGNMANSLKVSGLGVSPNIAEAVAVSVAAVPEPSTWVMAVIGLVGGGFLVRRRDRRRSGS